MSEKPIPISKILSTQEASHKANAGFVQYLTDRDLMDYQSKLPMFMENDVAQIIDDFNNTGGEINVLDIGCGQGVFLTDIVTSYPNLKAFGISSHDYRKPTSISKNYSDLKDYKVGDAHKIGNIFSGNSFDLIVSLRCFMYLADPLYVLKQAYNLTKPGGILLIDELGTDLTPREERKLSKYWKDHGIVSELERWKSYDLSDPSKYSLAIQRSYNPHLPLPFIYKSADIEHLSFRKPPISGKVEYKITI